MHQNFRKKKTWKRSNFKRCNFIKCFNFPLEKHTQKFSRNNLVQYLDTGENIERNF